VKLVQYSFMNLFQVQIDKLYPMVSSDFP
jgi:hypothetical protein